MIDFHVHLAGSGCCGSGIVISKSFQRRPSFLALRVLQRVTPSQMNNDIDMLWVRRLKNLVSESKGVSSAVALCLDHVYDGEGTRRDDHSQLYVPNSWGAKIAAESGGVLRFGASVHPYRKDAIEELHRVKEQGAFLIKWLPSMMGIDPADERCNEFYDTLRKLKLPLLSHTDLEYTFASLGENWKEKNDTLLLRFPLERGVTVIGAHAGTPTQIEKAEDLARHYPRFFLDTSGLFNPSRARSAPALFSRANAGVLGSRLLFGTDWPIPVMPILLVDRLGIHIYRRLAKIQNPFDRDLAIKEELGFEIARFEKNEQDMLTTLNASNS